MVIVLTVQKKKIKYIKTKLKKVQLKHFNMTPKEKAKELVDKFTIPYYQWVGDGYNIDWEETFKNRKQCALIAVDEILESVMRCEHSIVAFWVEVKQEIEKL